MPTNIFVVPAPAATASVRRFLPSTVSARSSFHPSRPGPFTKLVVSSMWPTRSQLVSMYTGSWKPWLSSIVRNDGSGKSVAVAPRMMRPIGQLRPLKLCGGMVSVFPNES